MTLRNVTLTAVAALAIGLSGGAFAQDSTTGTGAPAPSEPLVPTPAEPSSDAAEQPAKPEAATEASPAASATPEPAKPEATAPEAAAPAEEPTPAEVPAATVEEAPSDEAPAAASSEPAPTDATDAADAAPAETAADTPDDEAAKPESTDADTSAAETSAAEEPQAAEPAPSTEAPSTEDTAATAESDAEMPEAAPAEEPADAHAEGHIEDISFSFEGPFGKFDQFQIQRGLQVYTEVCAACHGLRYVPLRTLGDADGPGLPEDQVRAYAAELSIEDPELGEDRPRLPTDHFPTVLGDGMGPDLSLMAKARAGFHGPYGTGVNQFLRGIGGPEYIHAILTGFTGESKEEAGNTLYHNTAFAGGWISMPPPLSDDQVTYEDGTVATVDQMSRDVAAFLMWTAEPKLMARKRVGFVAVIFLIVLASLLYLSNKKLWRPIKHPEEPKNS